MLICSKCHKELEIKEVTFSYLDHQVTDKVLCCPQCGSVCIDEEFVNSKMKPLEESLEDK